MIGAVRGDREPDMRDHTGAFGGEELARGAGLDRPRVGIAAGAIETGLFERTVILSARITRQEGIISGGAQAGLRARGRGRGREPCESRQTPQESAAWRYFG